MSWSIIKYGMELDTKEYAFFKCAWYHQITLKRVSYQEYVSIHFTFNLGIIHILIKTTLRKQHCLQKKKKNLLGRVQWDCRLKTHLSIQATYWSQTSYQRVRRQKPASYYCKFSSVSRSVVSDSLRPHELQHVRPPCPSPTPGVYSNSCTSSR